MMKTATSYGSLDVFISKQKELLKMEQQEEVSERQRMLENQSLKELEKKGVCLRKLAVDHQKTGLFGRHIVIFTLPSQRKGNGLETISHRLTPGDIVGLYVNKGGLHEMLESGIISFSRSGSIGVAFNEETEMLNTSSLYRLMKLTNDVTYKRLNFALDLLNKVAASEPCSRLLDRLFPCKRLEERAMNNSIEIKEFFNKDLDDSQRDGVRFAIQAAFPISVLHGPPGTGKTTTVVEIVHQEVKHFSKKVLVCAPSNIAVDNLVERLSKAGIKVVRLGHPARVIEDVQKFSLDAILDAQDSSEIIRSVKADIEACFKSTGKTKSLPRDARRREVKELKKELISRQANAITEILKKADVVLSTTNSATKKDGPLKYLPSNHFDLLVIDEAAQAMEVSCWIPLLQVSRCILAGDHLQLPPTIISEKAAQMGLAVTLLERIVNGIGQHAVHMLTMQYRMNKLIMQWPSDRLYESKLLAAECVANHKLCDMPGVKQTPNTNVPIIFTDTAGCNMYELEGQRDESKGNTNEVEIVKSHVTDLINDGVAMVNIGIITPYNLQVELLRQAILPKYPKIEINSVDGFQGREKEAILISLVRSNIDGEVGFLKEDRRINVAVTRARRHLHIVGDSNTISNHPFLDSMCTFLFEYADLRSPRFDTQDGGATSSLNTADVRNLDYLTEIPSHSEYHRLKHCENQTAAKHPNTDPAQQKYKNKPAKDSKNISPSNEKSSCIDKRDSKEILENQIQDFIKLNSKFAVLEFPTNLTAKQRAFVHEIAESLNLHHESVGEGQTRRIVVKKMESATQTIPAVDSEKNKAPVSRTAIAAAKQQPEPKTEEQDDGSLICPTCSVRLPKSNIELHKIRCTNIQRQQQPQQTSDKSKNTSTRPKSSVPSTPASKKNNNKKKGGCSSRGTEIKTIKGNNESEDIDALLESFAEINSKCNFKDGCKTSIKILGQKCSFCSQMFCLSHSLAEIHGCGNAVKIQARRDIAKFHDSKPQPMNRIKKAQVQNKLSKKLTELEEERRRKSKNNKK